MTAENLRPEERLGRSEPRGASERTPDTDDGKGTETALEIWQSSTLALGTSVETYLMSLGINLPPPPVLRFHPSLRHPSGSLWPAMVALVANGMDGTPIAIHRTFLAQDGRGKAPVNPQKMMLGPCGGGAVRLGDPCGQAPGGRSHRNMSRRDAVDGARRLGSALQHWAP
jgi:hypothetical protein